MITRNIVNHLGETLGTLKFEDGTSEQEISAKLAEYAAPPPAPPKVPDITPRQARQALILSGISLSQIDEAIDSLPEPTKSLAKSEWEYSLAFQRDRPLVAQIGQMLGWSSEQLDNLWKFAATL